MTIPPYGSLRRLPSITNHAVPAGLTAFVERAVTVDYSDALGSEWLVLPSGCFGMRVILTGSYVEHDDVDVRGGSALASGVLPRALPAVCRRPVAVLAVAFTQLAAATLPFSAHCFDEFADVVLTEALGPSRPLQLRDKLAGTRSLSEKADVYLAWLESLFQTLRPAYGRKLAVAEVAGQMRQGRMLDIEEAARRVGVSRRQLERDFRLHVGVSPKQYAQVATFQRFAQLAWRGEGLAAIAAELELTDQAHLTRAVKAMSGITPAALLTRASQSSLTRLTRPHWGGRITYL